MNQIRKELAPLLEVNKPDSFSFWLDKNIPCDYISVCKYVVVAAVKGSMLLLKNNFFQSLEFRFFLALIDMTTMALSLFLGLDK